MRLRNARTLSQFLINRRFGEFSPVEDDDQAKCVVALTAT